MGDVPSDIVSTWQAPLDLLEVILQRNCKKQAKGEECLVNLEHLVVES